MTSNIDRTDNDNELYRSARQYVELGLPIVLLMQNHHPPPGLQQKIATNPHYYIENIELLQQDIRQYNIKHIAILFGLTGINDGVESGLILHGLDTDGEIFGRDGNKKKIIEELKTKTMVIKTRRPWGHLMLWFEHSKHHVPIQISDCIDQFHSLEIKCQNNARADVPPSTHRNDESFCYYNVGLEKVAVLDGLYDKLVDEDLRDCILPERHPYASRQQLTSSLDIDAETKTNSKKPYALSEETISALVPLAGKYYVEGSHDKFTFQLAGMMWHANINIESAIATITKICETASDIERLQKRIDTIKYTYTRGSKGLTVAGTTEFINLIQYLTGSPKEDAENVVRRIKLVWRIDAPGPELKQPIIIGLKGNKNNNTKKKRSSIKNYDNDNDDDSDIEPKLTPPSNAEILLRLAERKIPFLFANQFDEFYACIFVPNRVPLIYYRKEGFRIGIDHRDGNGVINHIESQGHSMNLSINGYHVETVPISSQKFKEYLMQIYREDSELQQERATVSLKQTKDQILQDEINDNQDNENNANRNDERNEEPIILHGKIVGTEAVRNVQTLLAYQARTKSPIVPTYKRVAPRFDESAFIINGEAGDVERTLSTLPQSQTSFRTPYLSALYYAMYDNQNRIIEITKKGWTIRFSDENIIFNIDIKNKQCSTQDSPYSLLPIFIRDSEISQIEPSRAYPTDIFEKFIDLTNIKNEDEQLLIKVYIISLFIPEIPHYMIIPYGTYGAAKSFLFKLIKLLVDPDKPLLFTLPKEKEQFVQQLSHSLVLYYDNIENVPHWFNAEVCSAVTGGGHRKRRLYTDNDDFIYEYMRCLGFNGINIALTKPDSLSRSILIEMAEIDKQNIEEERYLFYRLNQIKPQLLGYVMDMLVKTLSIYPTISLKRKVRMADYVVWGEAISQAMGNKPGIYAEILEANQNRQHVTAVLATPLGSFMIKFCKELLDKDVTVWKGQPDDLMDSLTRMIDDKILRVDKKELPGQSHKLISELNIIKPNLREGYGIKFENSRRPESGLSEITINLDKETFKRAVNYSKDDKDNNISTSTSNNGATDNNSKSRNQTTGSSSDKGEDKTMMDEEPPKSHDQHMQEPETATEDNDNKNNNNNLIKKKFGLGAVAETWDNSSYSDDEVEEDDDSHC